MSRLSLEGPLSKWTNVMKGWQYRWFVLDDNAGLLSYYTSREKMMKGARRGCVRLKNAIIGIDDEDDSTFTITVDQKVFHFQARHADERKQWASSLEDTIKRHSHHNFAVTKANFTDFEKSLAEADAYLQLMLTSVNQLQARMDSLGPGSEKDNIGHIISTAREMMEAVKKSVVLLQLAKRSVAKNMSEALGEKDSLPIYAPSKDLLDVDVKSDLTSNISSSSSLDTEEDEKVVDVVDKNVEENDISSPDELSQVPVTSYSSSDDETDDFYDADEVVSSQPNQPSINSTKVETKPIESDEVVKPSTSINQTDFFMNEDLENGTKGGESVEEHKSVIMHLLSQVKLGMDLTKVVLPTFILERRSLLEMYADFFSHPDLFVDIAYKPTAHERMISCLKFYLSTFSAGRDSSVAKKPYNPILGETFRCLYDLSEDAFTYDQTQSNDGPIPWAKNDQLAFLAEQVSHHPPVSAFYAEHKTARIQFSGHIWTKSKFLGLSIGVHNIGEGRITLLDLDETYVINFPNGYGRSILTVPWVELGGDCTITCEKTKHSAYIKFHTKPFYGGKPHRVTAEIYSPDSKKSYYSVEGEWNNKMFSKNECIFDASTCNKFPKFVQQIKDQIPTESRKLWQKVTINLAANNIDQATEAKRELENKQRKDAKDRVENGIVYKPKLFHENSDKNWTYNSLLSDRQ